MSSVTLTIDVAIGSFVVGILILVLASVYSMRYRNQLKAEESVERMERAVPLVLSRIVENVTNYNYYALLYNISKGEKNILARWLRKIIASYRANPTIPFDALLKRAIVDAYSQSALMMMFYGVLEMVRTVGEEAVDIISSVAKLSHIIITHSDEMKRRLTDSVKMTGLITTALVPVASSFAVVFFGGMNSILTKTSGVFQAIGNLQGGGQPVSVNAGGGFLGIGLKPLPFPMELLAVIFAVHVVVTAVVMSYLRIQLSGKYYAKAYTVSLILRQTSLSLAVYGIALFVTVNLMKLLFTV